MRDASPLRYPGGKWRFQAFIERVLDLNRLNRPHYIEPFAGGASLALSLLFRERVAEIHLNDLDPAIHSFWHSVLNRNQEFLEMLAQTPVSPEEWHNQKSIYARGSAAGKLPLGFATFFLNRTNHSGILNAGMIGGVDQKGRWKINARFNTGELERRIRRIHKYRSRINLSGEDAIRFLRKRRFPQNKFVYLDPPYYRSGRHLYLNAFTEADHQTLSKYLLQLRSPWIVSYDDASETRKLYKDVASRRLRLLHTAREVRKGEEVLYFSPVLRVPMGTR